MLLYSRIVMYIVILRKTRDENNDISGTHLKHSVVCSVGTRDTILISLFAKKSYYIIVKLSVWQTTTLDTKQPQCYNNILWANGSVQKQLIETRARSAFLIKTDRNSSNANSHIRTRYVYVHNSMYITLQWVGAISSLTVFI